MKTRRTGLLALMGVALATGQAAAEPGLGGFYYDAPNFAGAPLVRIDPTVNFNWAGGSPDASIANDTFSVRWEGSVRVPASGSYTFFTQSDDGVRLWVDCDGDGSFAAGEQLVNNWTDHGSTEDSGVCNFSSAGLKRLRMEYYENTGQAVAQLRWQSPAIAKQVIPADDGTRGLFVDTGAPTIASVTTHCGLFDTVTLRFNTPVDPATAGDPGNYTFNRGLSTLAARLLADGVTVALTLAPARPMAPATSYRVFVRRVGNLFVPGNAMNQQTDFTPVPGGLNSGLLASYYNQNGVARQYFTGNRVDRVDASVAFDWGSGAPLSGVGADDFSVRWSGYVQAPASGTYRFQTRSDDGVRLYLDDALIIDSWVDQGPTNRTSADIVLEAGRYHALTMEYYERGGGAVAELRWQPPASGSFSVIPATQLFHCDVTPPALSAVLASCGVLDRITAEFSEAVDPATAGDRRNYALSGGITVTAATVVPGGRSVSLSTSPPLAQGVGYTLTANAIGDAAIPTNLMATPSTASFSIPPGSLVTGLTGDYFSQNGVPRQYFTGTQVTRVDPQVNFSWGGGNPVAGIGADDFSVRWTGFVRTSTSGNYVFRTRSDDGVRLDLAGLRIIDNWTDHGPTDDNSAPVALVAGQDYPLVMEYYERSGGAVAQLSWSQSGAPFAFVPGPALFTCAAPPPGLPGGFNAFEAATPATDIAGVIQTKVAAQAFGLDVIALNSTRSAVDTAFVGDVRVELMDASNATGFPDANGCGPSWAPLAAATQTVSFAAADAGRRAVSFAAGAVPEVWRALRVRVSHPATGTPAVVGCSTDAFAVRPAALDLVATDGDRLSSGTTRVLNNLAVPGGVVHNAGRLFTLTITARNALGAVTGRYAGTPAVALVSHLLPAACAGSCTFVSGAFVPTVPGSVASDAASYDEVGVISLQASDADFAAVDAGDTPLAARMANSVLVGVGRFVPDRLVLAPGASVAAACASANQSYMGQPFAVAATLIAQNASGATTAHYDPALLGAAAVASVAWLAENGDDGIDRSTRLAVLDPVTNLPYVWSAGQFAAAGAGNSRFARPLPDAPDGPFDQLQIGLRATDPDAVPMIGLDFDPGTAGTCGAGCTGVAVGVPTSQRFGRARLANANGSNVRRLLVPFGFQFWNGSGFVNNGTDSCSALTSAQLSATAPQNKQGACAPAAISVGGACPAGNVCMAPVGANNLCAYTLSADVADWLHGRWDPAASEEVPDNPQTDYDDDPAARATFGTSGGPVIYQRENF